MRMRLFLASLLLASFAFGQGTPKDNRLYDQVRLKLAGDRDTGGNDIQVSVHDGVVTLSGKVGKDKQKAKAEHLAKKVKGVTKVINDLQVEYDDRK
jgi:osmotically-inducible protein OsmY